MKTKIAEAVTVRRRCPICHKVNYIEIMEATRPNKSKYEQWYCRGCSQTKQYEVL